MLSPSNLQSLRGFNYTPSTAYNDVSFWRDYDEALVEKELTYGQRLGLNCARPFLSYVVYQHDPKEFLSRVRHFVRSAYERGISTMPVVWDSCFNEIQPAYDTDLKDWIPNPGVMNLGRPFWPQGERYCADLAQTLGPEPGLLLWDIMNEPLMTSWVQQPSAEQQERMDIIWTFVRHFCGVMQRLDEDHPVTCGVHTADNLAMIGGEVDILSFHDYSPTRQSIRRHLRRGLEFAGQFQKPIFLSEIACLARANPYDVAIQTCQEAGLGWFIWELMIGCSRWNDIHGIVYPDGTVRDPAIVAAVQGFFRKRGPGRVAADLDKEGQASRAVAQAKQWLNPTGDGSAVEYDAGLEILETLANLIEAGELVGMADPPGQKVWELSTNRDMPDLKKYIDRYVNVLLNSMPGCTGRME